jgi:hypothetical protein
LAREKERGRRRNLLFLYLFPGTWRLAQPPSVLAATHAGQAAKERMEPRQEPAEEGELASVVGKGPARSMSLRALLAQAGGERET